jgi:hypothetical protein
MCMRRNATCSNLMISGRHDHITRWWFSTFSIIESRQVHCICLTLPLPCAFCLCGEVDPTSVCRWVPAAEWCASSSAAVSSSRWTTRNSPSGRNRSNRQAALGYVVVHSPTSSASGPRVPIDILSVGFAVRERLPSGRVRLRGRRARHTRLGCRYGLQGPSDISFWEPF